MFLCVSATESHWDTLIDAYYTEFCQVCTDMQLDPCSQMPWTREEFSEKARTVGLFLTFMWCSTSYELVAKYPALKERVHWVIAECFKRAPQLLSD